MRCRKRRICTAADTPPVPKKRHRREAILLELVTVSRRLARQKLGRLALGQTNRPATINRAATTAAARVKGHTDDQLPERKGAVEETTTAIRAE
jgi:hypothetical protein